MTRQKNIAMTWGVFPMIFLLVMLFGVDPSNIKTFWSCLIFVLLSYLSMPLAYYGFSKEGFQVLRYTSLFVSFMYFIIELLVAIGFLTFWNDKPKVSLVVQLVICGLFLTTYLLTSASNQSSIDTINNKQKKY